MTTRSPWIALLMAGGLATVNCGDAGGPPATSAPPRRPSIVLITLDTLRADRLGLYGYPRPTSPRLDEFAESATVYHRAHAPSPWTLPSHASLFTGLYPFEHGAHRHLGSGPDAARIPVTGLADELPTLAETLAAGGYTTGAIVANESYLAPGLGLEQGFATYDNKREHAPRINQRVGRWLDARGGGPFFLFINYMDTHQPYNIRPREGFPPPGSADAAGDLIQRVRALNSGAPADATRRMLQRLAAQYELAVANLDDGLGQLFDNLRHRGLFDDALIVVTSDHGELFGEHDLIEHGKDVYQGLLHVPLIVKLPGQQIRHDDHALISLVHVPGLLLGEVDIALPATELAGYRTHWPRGALFAENHKPWTRSSDRMGDRFAAVPRVRRVYYEQDFKYIHSSDGQHELFDLAADPRETRDTAGQHAEWSARATFAIRSAIDAAASVAIEGPAVERTDAELEQLRAVGYMDDGD